MITPLLKWAGGKRQLLAELGSRLPDTWNTYYEPFVGGGAMLVHLYNTGLLEKAVVSDLNSELINLYSVVRKKPGDLIEILAGEKFQNEEDAFNALKAEFNRLTGSPGNEVERAALLIYLNKHGFNGLWRVNKKGKFNVPFGRHARRNLPSPDSLKKFSDMLRLVKLVNADFEKVTKPATKGDFIYFDPPYHPLSRTASFTDYNSNGFCFADQERLAKLCRKLDRKGVCFMLSNSKVPEVEELYKDFRVDTVPAKRFINCNGERRSGAFEIIVTNSEYP